MKHFRPYLGMPRVAARWLLQSRTGVRPCEVIALLRQYLVPAARNASSRRRAVLLLGGKHGAKVWRPLTRGRNLFRHDVIARSCLTSHHLLCGFGKRMMLVPRLDTCITCDGGWLPFPSSAGVGRGGSCGFSMASHRDPSKGARRTRARAPVSS